MRPTAFLVPKPRPPCQSDLRTGLLKARTAIVIAHRLATVGRRLIASLVLRKARLF